MKNKYLYILFLAILMIACSGQKESIVKKNHSLEKITHKPELIEENKTDEPNNQIIFSLPYKQVTVDLNNVPILKEYLQFFDDQKEIVEHMNIIPLEMGEQTAYLLEFSCEGNHCSYLLLDEMGHEQSYLIADMALFSNTFKSPDQQKILLQFQRTGSSVLPLADLVLVDVVNWKILPIIPADKSFKQKILHYQWPITDIIWNHDEIITAYIPKIQELADDHIEQWKKSGKETTQVILHIQK